MGMENAARPGRSRDRWGGGCPYKRAPTQSEAIRVVMVTVRPFLSVGVQKGVSTELSSFHATKGVHQRVRQGLSGNEKRQVKGYRSRQYGQGGRVREAHQRQGPRKEQGVVKDRACRRDCPKRQNNDDKERRGTHRRRRRGEDRVGRSGKNGVAGKDTTLAQENGWERGPKASPSVSNVMNPGTG